MVASVSSRAGGIAAIGGAQFNGHRQGDTDGQWRSK
jgi:hypothetical protein